MTKRIGNHHTKNTSSYCKPCATANVKLFKVKTEAGTRYFCEPCLNKRKREYGI